MKAWLIATGALAIFLSPVHAQTPAAAQNYVGGLYDGRSVSGWTFLENQSGDIAFWGLPSTSGPPRAVCSVSRLPGMADLDAWRRLSARLTPERFADIVDGDGEGPIAQPGSRLEQVSLSGRPTLHHEMSTADQRGRYRSLHWWVSGVEAIVQINCQSREEISEQMLPLEEAFAASVIVLTTGLR